MSFLPEVWVDIMEPLAAVQRGPEPIRGQRRLRLDHVADVDDVLAAILGHLTNDGAEGDLVVELGRASV
jgi:hypothetical protein